MILKYKKKMSHLLILGHLSSQGDDLRGKPVPS